MITYGWQFSTVVALPETPSSWTFILSQRRITSQRTAIEEAYAQIQQLVPLPPAETIVCLDRGYDSTWLWCQGSGLGIGVLGRIKRNRRLYRAAPPQQESEERHAKMEQNCSPTIQRPMEKQMAWR